ncbi:unnamed protein product [Parascedosporium putredinis]|uniref:Copper acquisition factor BIM1-like domain-containing protein n=1 Tax=Parascedosporium putredinis TaxID=1442378 RepID=A0A9P1H1W5_9PEZI|nr:unnamed protein product [Parascedosporium putredinis]CAI7994168.1 unnamed protein product [Parascedosporium putredinis]
MRFTTAAAATAFTRLAAAAVHGEGALGTTMGPVDFLWPYSRAWSAETDNIAPCGSPEGPTKRTNFPSVSLNPNPCSCFNGHDKGTVALSIADDAYNVAFFVAVDDNPISINSFQSQVVSNINSIEAGHQCYLVNNLPTNAAAGTNATIQLKYWADPEDDGTQEVYYACADITFVELESFDTNPLASTDSSSSDKSNSDSSSDNTSSSSGGLSTGAKAGIAVGVVVASLAVVGAVAFLVFRRNKKAPADTEAPTGKEVREVSPDRVSRRS